MPYSIAHFKGVSIIYTKIINADEPLHVGQILHAMAPDAAGDFELDERLEGREPQPSGYSRSAITCCSPASMSSRTAATRVARAFADGGGAGVLLSTDSVSSRTRDRRSAYAKANFRSRHNQVYWHGQEYLGLGPGAAGFLGGVRYTNVKPVARYSAMLEAGEFPLGQWEQLTAQQRQRERLILGLRLGDGIPQVWLDAQVADGPSRLGELLKTWEAEGLLMMENGRVRLTETGFLLSDSLFVDLL